MRARLRILRQGFLVGVLAFAFAPKSAVRLLGAKTEIPAQPLPCSPFFGQARAVKSP